MSHDYEATGYAVIPLRDLREAFDELSALMDPEDDEDPQFDEGCDAVHYHLNRWLSRTAMHLSGNPDDMIRLRKLVTPTSISVTLDGREVWRYEGDDAEMAAANVRVLGICRDHGREEVSIVWCNGWALCDPERRAS